MQKLLLTKDKLGYFLIIDSLRLIRKSTARDRTQHREKEGEKTIIQLQSK